MQIYTKLGTSPCLLSKKCCPAVFKRRDIRRDFSLVFELVAIASVADGLNRRANGRLRAKKVVYRNCDTPLG